jgi:hypothetical protein
MTRANWKIVTVLAVWMLVPAIAGAEDFVTRPFTIAAHSQLVVQICSSEYPYVFGCPYVADAEGVASHLGRVAVKETGIFPPVLAEGTITAANGDLLFYTQGFNSTTVTITGGTGRFEGATGELEIVILELVGPVFNGATATTTLTWTGSGTITY